MLAESSNRKTDNFLARKYRETEQLCDVVKHNLSLSHQLLFRPTANDVHNGRKCVSLCVVCQTMRMSITTVNEQQTLVYLVSGPVIAVQHTIAINMTVTEYRSYICHAIKIILTSNSHVVSCINTGNSDPIVQLSYSDCVFLCNRHSKVRRQCDLANYFTWSETILLAENFLN